MSGVKVVLIGGPPGAGKTTVARAVGARLGFLSTTVDDLVSTARWLSDDRSQPALHRIARGGAPEYFTNGPPEKLIADAVALENVMWPALERLIKRHSEHGQPIVLDWWLFDPDRVAGLSIGGVSSVWLHIDPAVLDRRERRQVSFREGSADPERMHANFMHRSRWRNQLLAERATANGMSLLRQDGTRSVEDLTEETLRFLGR